MNWDQIEQKLRSDYSHSVCYLGSNKQAIMKRWGEGLEAAIFSHKKLNKNEIKIHDCSCGTGLQLIPLAKRGFKVSGSDRTGEVVKICENELTQLDLQANVFQHDCIKPYPEEYLDFFDVAISVNNGNAHLCLPESDRDSLTSAFLNIKNILKPNGLFFYSAKPLDIYQKERAQQPHGSRDFELLEDGLRFTIKTSYIWTHKLDFVTSQTQYLVENSLGESRKFIFESPFKIWQPEEILNCLLDAGFSDVSTNMVEQPSDGYKERWFTARR